MALKLSYCQLIKIVLSQIGGSPLQQVYTQLSQGLQQITKGGIIPSEFSQLKSFVDQVTTSLNGVAGDINAMQQLTQQFFYNPVGTITTQTIAQIDLRLAQIEDPLNPGNGTAGNTAEYTKLTSLRADLVSFKTHTDTLAGVTEPTTTGGFGGCTLADLLGNGCAPAADVPDVDLQILIDGFKSGAVITTMKNNLTTLVATQTGYTNLVSSIDSLRNTLQTFNTTVTSRLNKIIIQKAVETYITNLAFNLLSGCSSPLINATIRPEAATALTPFVAYQQKILAGTLNADGSTPGASDTTLTT